MHALDRSAQSRHAAVRFAEQTSEIVSVAVVVD
jgi:hypothetical protein